MSDGCNRGSGRETKRGGIGYFIAVQAAMATPCPVGGVGPACGFGSLRTDRPISIITWHCGLIEDYGLKSEDKASLRATTV
jgi:hypothetical protein